MKIFMDTANVEEISSFVDWGVVYGVTTNPSLIAKTGRTQAEVIPEIAKLVEGPVSAEVISTECAGMVEEARKTDSQEAELQSLQNKINSLTANLDKMYMDRLSGILAEADFERIYQRIKMERSSLEEKIKDMKRQQKSAISNENRAKLLVERFVDSAFTNREMLVSLIERVELTADKQVIVRFRFKELEKAG